MRRYPIIALLSVLNVLVLLSMLGEWGSLFGFIAEIPAHDFGYFVVGSVELLGYYLASLLIVSLSFCNMSAVRAAAVCLLLDMAFCLLVYRLFFIV